MHKLKSALLRRMLLEEIAKTILASKAVRRHLVNHSMDKELLLTPEVTWEMGRLTNIGREMYIRCSVVEKEYHFRQEVFEYSTQNGLHKALLEKLDKPWKSLPLLGEALKKKIPDLEPELLSLIAK
jgi:hypothetical protein